MISKDSIGAFKNELQKIGSLDSSQLQQGIEIEKEHLPTVNKIRASVKDGKVTMSNEDIYKSIAADHLNESGAVPYYLLLKNMEDVIDGLKERK